MEKLLSKIKNDLKNAELQQKDVAKHIGVSKESLTYYLKGENQFGFVSFYKLLKMIYKDPTLIEELMLEFIGQTTKKSNFREALELSSNYGYYSVLDLAIKKEKEENNGLELALIYQLLKDRNQRKINGDELFKKIDGIKHSFKGKIPHDISALMEIATLYAYLDMKAYQVINLSAASIIHRLENLKSGYVKNSLEFKVRELIAISLMKNGSIEESKNMALGIINAEESYHFPMVLNSMYCLLSELYLFNDKTISLNYINKAIDNFNQRSLTTNTLRKNMLIATHDFIKIYHKDYDGLYLTDPIEKAHFLASQPNKIPKKQALDLLESEIIKKNKKYTPFQLYYKALATGSKLDMNEARKEFYKCGDFYYCKLTEIY